jgi:hypothetical protein
MARVVGGSYVTAVMAEEPGSKTKWKDEQPRRHDQHCNKNQACSHQYKLISSQFSTSFFFPKTTWKIHFVTGVRKRNAKNIEENKHNPVLRPMCI